MNFVFVFCVLLPSVIGVRPLATTEYGDVLGTEWWSLNGRKINAFMSIPYAKPPTGRLRFEEAQEPDPWPLPLDCGTPSPACIQSYGSNNNLIGQEDCLYLNVFSPHFKYRNSSLPLPVLIFIHGGAFYFLSASLFGPRFLLDKDMILVTLNYRLGIFGFLSTEDSACPGNIGLKDQLMALAWVKRNIAQFGGYPKSVTLFGMSAGAASVHFHYFSQRSRGLFHRGFILGGSAFNVWSMQKKPLEKAVKSAEWLGCPPSSNTSQLLHCLRLVPASLLARTVHLFKNRYGPMCPWSPVVEVSGGDQAFLSEYPLESLRKRRHSNLPLLVSDTTQPGIFPTVTFMNDTFLLDLDENWENLAPYLLDMVDTLDPLDKDWVLGEVREHYFGEDNIYNDFSRFLKMMSDRVFLAELGKGITLQAALNSRIWVYLFNYTGTPGIQKLFIGNEVNLGVGHIDDFYYIMNRTCPEAKEFRQTDLKMIGRLTNMIYLFMTTGRAVFIPGLKWPVQRGPSHVFNYLRVDSPDSAVLQEDENFGDRDFWDGLPLVEPWTGRGGN